MSISASSLENITLRSHSTSVTSISFLKFAQDIDFFLLVTGDQEGSIILWDSDPYYDQLASWRAHDGGILALLPDPRKKLYNTPCLLFWSQGRDGCIHLWEWEVIFPSSSKVENDSSFLDDLLDTKVSISTFTSAKMMLVSPLPNKLETIRSGFGSFCCADILYKEIDDDNENVYILSPTINATEIEVWKVGISMNQNLSSKERETTFQSASASASSSSSSSFIVCVGQFAVPSFAVSEAAAILGSKADTSEDEKTQGTIMEEMKGRSGMVMCAKFLHHQISSSNKSLDHLLLAVCFESGSIFVLKCQSKYQEEIETEIETKTLKENVTVLVTLPICKDTLLSFSLFQDDTGGAAVGSGSFIFIFSLDVTSGKGEVNRKISLASPGSNSSILLQFPNNRNYFAFGCWDSSIRYVTCDISEGSMSCADRLLISHRSSVNSLATTSSKKNCHFASGDKEGKVILTKLLQKE